MRSDLRTGLTLVLALVGLTFAAAGLALSFGVVPATSAPAAGAKPSVDAEVPVTAMDAGREVANNSPALVADPRDERFVAMANRVDAPEFSCALQLSGDGGRSWTSARPVPKLPAGAERCYAPEAAFDQGGRLYYLFVGLAGTGNEPMGVFLTTSDDRARSFTSPKRVLGPLNFGARMAIEPDSGERGRLHLVWLHATSDPPLGAFGPPPNPVMASYSDDGGTSFSEPVQVSDPARQRVAAPVLALGTDGSVHVGYFDLGEDVRDYQGLEGPVWEGTWSLVVSTSRDGGRRFPRGVVVDSEVVPFERVMLIFTMPPASLVADEDRLCAAWGDARHGDADVLLRCSRTGGRTWDGVRRLNDDLRGNGRTQHLPRLSLSPNGRLDAIFYDRRADPKDVLNEVSYTYSSDGGRRFSPNTRLTRDSFESRIGQRYVGAAAANLVEFGSRLALLSRSDEAIAAWTDTRNSTRLVGTTGQDIFATSLELPKGRGSAAMARLIGVGLALAGACFLGLAARRASQSRRQQGATAGRPASSRRRATAILGVVPVAAAILVTRAGSTTPGYADLPVRPPTVVVAMREQAFSYSRPVPSGRVLFRVPNRGSLVHRLVMVPLADDLPGIGGLIGDDQITVVAPFAAVRPQAPGATGTFAVDLAPGARYAMVCLVRDRDGKTHAQKGMVSEFRAGGGGTKPAAKEQQ
ncbi:MAG TPA: sialidase family protein [Acidimicrobiales bacterium]|nr:sialidase family protein [Acidimicrobiales bacterium]